MDTTDYADHSSRILDGEAHRFGDVFWPRLEPPLLDERCALLAEWLPAGTIAAGVTAGWAWTGMGIPTPLSLVAKTQPAPSPLIRHAYNIRGISVPDTRLVLRRGLTLLSLKATVDDLWTCEGRDEVAAAQLFWLTAERALTPPRGKPSGISAARYSLVGTWREAYPWATRYTS